MSVIRPNGGQGEKGWLLILVHATGRVEFLTFPAGNVGDAEADKAFDAHEFDPKYLQVVKAQIMRHAVIMRVPSVKPADPPHL